MSLVYATNSRVSEGLKYFFQKQGDQRDMGHGDYINFYFGGQAVNKNNIVKKWSLKCMQWGYILLKKRNATTIWLLQKATLEKKINT